MKKFAAIFAAAVVLATITACANQTFYTEEPEGSPVNSYDYAEILKNS